MDEYSFDRLGWSNDKAILSIIGKEKIIYSNKVYKYNSLSLKNERYLLLTDKCLYNIKNKKVKREMQYQLMLGITYSVQSNEFVIHASEGFDFHFLSDEKLIIIYLIAKCYEMINNESIIICKVNDKSLKQFVISKKLKKKDFKNTKLNKKYIIDTRTFIADNPPNKNYKRRFTNCDGDYLNNFDDFIRNKTPINNEVILSSDKNIKIINFEDFTIKGIINRSRTGKVMLSLCEKNSKYYALKFISKSNLEINENFDINLKNKLVNLYYHFLNNVEFCFQSNINIYFAFPYIKGELLYNYIKKENGINENSVKFYSGILLLSIKYLHTYNIIGNYFSTKNIIINEDGYLKIIPYHLGKILPFKKDYYITLSEKYKNEYTPPEVYLELNINKKICDWWNLGILIFEMIYGITPFYSDDNIELKKMICNNELIFPKEPIISDNCKDLIKQLLNKKYEKRLGFNNDFDDIRNHAFFKDINLSDLLNKKIKSPYKPNINDNEYTNEKDKFNKMFTFEDLIKNGIKDNYKY